MTAFRYDAIGDDGSAVSGLVEAEDRRSALQALSRQRLFPSKLEVSAGAPAPASAPAAALSASVARPTGWRLGGRVSRKDG